MAVENSTTNTDLPKHARNAGAPSKARNPDDERDPWLVFGVITTIVLLLLCLYWYAVQQWLPIDPEDAAAARGQFGDMFGGANALFSGLAFAGLIYTIYLQRRELMLQRTELKLTRDEITKQADQMVEQSKTFNLQQFDSTFFHLLHLQASIVSDLASPRSTLTGRRLFGDVVRHLEGSLRRFRTECADRKTAVQGTYDLIDDHMGRVLGHYFRNLYHVIKFVDTSDFDHAAKQRYTSFARAQVSEDETIALFFNCQTPRASKFVELIERYALLEHLPLWILDPDELKLYAPEAYGDNAMLLALRDSK